MGVLGVWEEEAGVLVAAVDDEFDDGRVEPIDWATDQVLPLLLALDPAVTCLLADNPAEDEVAADEDETE